MFDTPQEVGMMEQLDMNELLIRDRTATFILRVSGHSMTGAGIHDGDHIILDRSIEPKHGDVVIAVLNAELTVKRLDVRATEVVLCPANPAYPDIHVDDPDSLRILGVVTECLHHLWKGPHR